MPPRALGPALICVGLLLCVTAFLPGCARRDGMGDVYRAVRHCSVLEKC